MSFLSTTFRAAFFTVFCQMLPSFAFAQDNTNQRLDALYSKPSNFEKVYNNVESWFAPLNNGSTTYNGCAAFASTALRLIGVNVPLKGTYDGEPISMVTLPFSKYLERELDWDRITSASELEAGDVVFTVEDPRYPGYPSHTYVFHEWDGDDGSAMIMDNQVTSRNQGPHLRNVIGQARVKLDVFAYALREKQDPFLANVTVKEDTFFKFSPAQSSDLPTSKKCRLKRGTVLSAMVLGRTDGHVEIRLEGAIPNCDIGREGSEGYLFSEHVRSQKL